MIDLFPRSPTYSFQKLDGFVALERNKLVINEELTVGDTVELFVLPNGKHLLSKTEDAGALKIEKVTQAYIFFETEITIKEE